ncbi:MAG: serine hydrolase [Rhizobiales bacterium]|nr:serine hydrolase [Hyphomicrobiales bacterium]
MSTHGSRNRIAGGLIASALLAAPAAALAEPVARDKVLAALPKLEEMARTAVERDDVPGLAIAVVQGDDVLFVKGFGVREAGKAGQVGPDTVFQLASFSKPISATVVAAIVGQKRVAWDSKIADLDPAFRLADAYPTSVLTVEDLFNHRSGLPGLAGNELEDLGYDQAEILHRLRLVPLDGFRSHYSYSNFGLTEGAVAVAKSLGIAWPDLAEETLYRPLGMSATSSRYADFLKHEDRSELHVKIDGEWTAAVKRLPDAQAPAGGVSSTAHDLATWLKLEINNGRVGGEQFIAEDALAATHQPLMDRGKNPVTGAQSFYGLGWNIEYGRHGLSWGHAGAFSTGARTLVTILPEEKLGIVVLANAFPTGLPEGLADSFFDLALDGKIEKDWIKDWDAAYSGLFDPAVKASEARFAHPPQPALPPLALTAYAGRYANDYIGAATVSQEGDSLVLALGPEGKRRFALTPFTRDTFLMYSAAEMPTFRSTVTFAIGPDGKAETVRVESLDDLGLGTLKRTE